MSQTQIKSQIIQILKDLKKELPIDVWKFKKMVEEALNCEFSYSEATEPTRRYDIAENLKVYIYEVEFVVACNEEIEFKNTIYIDNLEDNMIYLIHYEV